MAQIANLVALDAATTPVSHTFVPVQSGKDAKWRENNAALPLIGQPVITSRIIDASKGSDLDKVVFTVEVPVLESTGGVNSQGYTAAPKVAFTLKYQVTAFISKRASLQQKKDVHALFKNALADNQVTDIMWNLNTPF